MGEAGLEGMGIDQAKQWSAGIILDKQISAAKNHNPPDIGPQYAVLCLELE